MTRSVLHFIAAIVSILGWPVVIVVLACRRCRELTETPVVTVAKSPAMYPMRAMFAYRNGSVRIAQQSYGHTANWEWVGTFGMPLSHRDCSLAIAAHMERDQ